MHRGTTIQDAGYKQGTSWPFVPDIQNARECTRFIRLITIATVPVMAAGYAAMFLTGSSVLMSFIAPAAALVLALLLILRFKKVRHGLLMNCKMFKVLAEQSGVETEHAAKTIFGAITQNGGTERIAALNDEFGIYVNVGYRMDDGRVENPYLILIRKEEAEEIEEQQAA